jgi:hypothetical protein
VTVRKAAADQRLAGNPRPLVFQGWGDSLNGNTHHTVMKATLQDMGFDPTFQGTIGQSSGASNEGRGGDSWSAFVGKFTDAASVGQRVIAPGTAAWNAYMALSEDATQPDNKILYHPALRAATGSDPSYRVFRTSTGSPVTLDIQNYLTRAGYAAPDVFVFGFGTGDENHHPTDPAAAVADAVEGIGITLDVIREQFGPGKKALFWTPSIPRGNGIASSQDASEQRWPQLHVPFIKGLVKWFRDRADANAAFIGAWPFLDPVGVWNGNGVAGKEVIVSTDALSGAADVDWLDNIHYDTYGRHQINEEICAGIAWHLGVQQP